MYYLQVIFINLGSFRASIYVVGLCLYDTPLHCVRGFRDVITAYNIAIPDPCVILVRLVYYSNV